MTVRFAEGELRHFSYKSGFLTWVLGAGDYCLIDWVGLKHKPNIKPVYSGLITKATYLKNAPTLDRLYPARFPDSLLLTRRQVLKLLRWPKDPVVDRLAEGDIGWVPPEAGVFERQLLPNSRKLIKNIKDNPLIALETGPSGISLELEFLSYILHLASDQESISSTIETKYSSNIESFVSDIRELVVANDVEMRHQFGDTILQNIYHKNTGANLSKSSPEVQYLIGTNSVIFAPDDISEVSAWVAQNIVEKVSAFYYMLVKK